MILITGNLGFIGKKLTQALPSNQWVGIDMREGHNLLTCPLPLDFSIECIYHLAAQSDVMASWDDPVNDMDNLRMTARLVKQYPDIKIIYANSCASLDPQSPYGFSKKVSGDYLKTFHKNTVNCVFPNIYGTGSRSVVDIFKGKKDVVVYGDGNQTRDYVHVDDIVAGLIKAKDWPAGDYLMGSGKNTTVNQLAKGRNVTYLPARKEPYEVVVPNTTPDWEPEIDVMGYIW